MSDGPDKTDELYPIAVLIDELKVHDQTPTSSGGMFFAGTLLTINIA
jgi:hypothetical protein